MSGQAATPGPSHVVVASPNKPRPDDPWAIAIADSLRRTEINYDREGSGPGSRFEGELLEDVQARVAISMMLARQAEAEAIAAAAPAPQADTEGSAFAAYFKAKGWDDWFESEARDAFNAGMRAAAAPAPQGACGTGLIAAERARQAAEEGYTADHDREHASAELSLAAAAYALAASGRWEQGLVWWPFDGGFKPGREPLANLVKAGALVAAEIDRLQGTVPQPQPAPELAALRNRLADAAARRLSAEAERDRLRELLGEIGIKAANTPEDGDSFGVLEEIAMRIAAAGVPDTTPVDEWPDPENPVTGRTPGGC